MERDWDVVVVGTGAAGLLAALRVAHHGLKVIVLEKEELFGGTTAASGGAIWVPCHGQEGHADSREEALAYLVHLTAGEGDEERLAAYLDNAPRMVSFLLGEGIALEVLAGFPDYYPEAPGSASGRSLIASEFDGKELGDDYLRMRLPCRDFMLSNRYSLDLGQSLALSARPIGWQWVVARMLARYWLDLAWRFKTRRDRRATMGNALIGRLFGELNRRGVPVVLNVHPRRIISEGGRVMGLEVDENGEGCRLGVRRGLILAAGGFEQSQDLRSQNLPIETDVKWSLTPRGANTGEMLVAARDIGAATQFLRYCWWAPSMQLPSGTSKDLTVTHQMFFDHRHPHSVVVNRLGKRFVNESCTYDDFGKAMIADQQETGTNLPCWIVFDATYRRRYTCGGIMPGTVVPDRKVPKHWWDTYLYRAPSIAELAEKIRVPALSLESTVARMNGFAASGRDEEFGRGKGQYDRFFGDQRTSPNPCLGAIDNPPYYAVRIDLGDLGTKGGLKVDANSQVLDTRGKPIGGLYAAGNCAASPFANCYPGSGGTIGPAMTFALVAADHISGCTGGAVPHE